MKNVFKILSLTVALGALIFTTSCGEDDGVKTTPDTASPSIVINAPANGSIVVAGSQTASSITISDDVEISSVSITLGNGTVTVIDISETEVGSTSFSFSDNLSIPANVVLGEHTLTITVEDASGNTTTETITVDAYPVYTDGQTTVLIPSVPSQVTDYTGDNQIRMVGTHQEVDGAGAWDVASDTHPLLVHTDSENAVTYYQQVANTGAEFKFVRGLAWEMVQKDENGKEATNNMIESGVTKATFEIGTWRDYNPEVSNGSSGTIISIDGALTADNFTLKGNIKPAITTASTVSSSTYTVVASDDSEVTTGSLTLDGEGNFSQSIDISTYALGDYSIIVSATDAAGNSGREDKVLNLVEFPCDDSGETAVVSSMTRIIVNVSSTSDDIYATGNFDGDIWGTVDDKYKLTKLSDGCYYIDLTLTSGQIVQFFRSNAGYADWWRGQATNTAGSDATANFNVDADSDGSTAKLYYAYWREEPSN
jgi:hypothetical protein